MKKIIVSMKTEFIFHYDESQVEEGELRKRFYKTVCDWIFGNSHSSVEQLNSVKKTIGLKHILIKDNAKTFSYRFLDEHDRPPGQDDDGDL